jgi:hypothetical protein
MAKKHRRAKVLSRSINKRRKEKTKGRADLKFDFRLQSVSDNWDSHKTLKQLRIEPPDLATPPRVHVFLNGLIPNFNL